MEASAQTSYRIRFAVADVAPASHPLPVIGLKAILERTTRTRILSCPGLARDVLQLGDFHPLIAAAFLAFKHHYPLVLSPDMIWQTVLQGVAQHIQNHAEKLRDRLVRHQTKIELVVNTNKPTPPQNDRQMLEVTRAFTDAIIRHVPPDKHFLFQTEFSTTTDVDRIAQCVALMDAFQPYFDYVIYCVCGIPSVILEGGPDDWKLLQEKVKSLHESDLELDWWTKHLLPLCDHFVRAAEGDVDRDHWQNLCKIIKRYGTEDLNGWLLKFIPYLKEGKNEPVALRNPVLELTCYPDSADDAKRKGVITGCTSDQLPGGLSRAPVTCVLSDTGRREELEFIAGLVGVTQSPADLSLRPLTGWAICEGKPIDRLIKQLQHHHETLPPAGMDLGHMLHNVFHQNLPADVWRFYTCTDGATIKLPAAKNKCRILPLAEICPVWDVYTVRGELQAMNKKGAMSVQELKDQDDFNWAYGRLLRIAQLDDGKWFVFGSHPEVERRISRDNPVSSWPSQEEREARAVFLWDGGRMPESFTFVASNFTGWLAALLDGSLGLVQQVSDDKVGGPPG